MRLDTFVIADAVAAPADGKFYIHGGGLTRLEVPDLPFPIELGIFARFEVSDEELLAKQALLIALIGPTGNPNIPPLKIERPPNQDLEPTLEGEKRFLQIALSLRGLAVRDGLYHMEISVNDEKYGSIPFPVVVDESQATTEFIPAAPKVKRSPNNPSKKPKQPKKRRR